MMRTTLALLLAGGSLLVAAPARGATGEDAARENVDHQLLSLELQEVLQHSKALHFQVHDRAQVLDAGALRTHLTHLGRSLDEIDATVKAIQEIDGDGTDFDFHLAEVHNHAALAREQLERLQLEAANTDLDREHVDCSSALIFDHAAKATAHQRQTMGRHRVVAAPRPTVDA